MESDKVVNYNDAQQNDAAGEDNNDQQTMHAINN